MVLPAILRAPLKEKGNAISSETIQGNGLQIFDSNYIEYFHLRIRKKIDELHHFRLPAGNDQGQFTKFNFIARC